MQFSTVIQGTGFCIQSCSPIWDDTADLYTWSQRVNIQQSSEDRLYFGIFLMNLHSQSKCKAMYQVSGERSNQYKSTARKPELHRVFSDWLCDLHYGQTCSAMTGIWKLSGPSTTVTVAWNYIQLQRRAQKTQGWLVTLRHPSLRWPISERTLLLKRRMNSCYWWVWPEGWGRGKRERFKPGKPCSPGNSHPHVNKAWVCLHTRPDWKERERQMEANGWGWQFRQRGKRERKGIWDDVLLHS